MWIFAIVLGLIAPRVTIALLWLFTQWFEGVFDTRAWPILGFLFTPLTLLWYSVVEKCSLVNGPGGKFSSLSSSFSWTSEQ